MSDRQERSCFSGAPTTEGLANAVPQPKEFENASLLCKGDLSASNTPATCSKTFSVSDMDTSPPEGKLSPELWDNQIPFTEACSTPSHPEKDLRTISDEEAVTMMVKYRSVFSTFECRSNKLKRKSPDEKDLKEILENEEALRTTWKSMEILPKAKGISIVFNPPPPIANPTPTHPLSSGRSSNNPCFDGQPSALW